MFIEIKNPFSGWGWFNKKPPEPKPPTREKVVSDMPNHRVSVPNDGSSIISAIKGMTNMVTPSFQKEVIPLLRKLSKVNPDLGIVLQDMYKLSNSGHYIEFVDAEDDLTRKMRTHIENVQKGWAPHLAGVDGIVNKIFLQLIISGATAIECVPNKDLTGISHIIFLKPEDIVFQRDSNGRYQPYQVNRTWDSKKEQYIKLNQETFFYVALFNDLDEPYGIPPFMPSLDSIKTQSDMKVNFKHILELMGFMGFVEVLVEKPDQKASESDAVYTSRLLSKLVNLKESMLSSLKDGVVTGYKDDHEFKFNSTSKDVGNVDKLWNMNQQSLANGLGAAGSLIGVSTDNKTEGGTSIMFSKLISQLKNLQMTASNVMARVYKLELLLAGYTFNTLKVKFYTSTVTDDIKIQQALEIKIRNFRELYNQGVISQDQVAFGLGYDKPDQKEPRAPMEEGTDPVSKAKREADKDKSDRKGRDKSNPNPKRKDGDTKER